MYIWIIVGLKNSNQLGIFGWIVGHTTQNDKITKQQTATIQIALNVIDKMSGKFTILSLSLSLSHIHMLTTTNKRTKNVSLCFPFARWIYHEFGHSPFISGYWKFSMTSSTRKFTMSKSIEIQSKTSNYLSFLSYKQKTKINESKPPQINKHKNIRTENHNKRNCRSNQFPMMNSLQSTLRWNWSKSLNLIPSIHRFIDTIRGRLINITIQNDSAKI